MRLRDLFSLGIRALFEQKLRTLLTTVGVVIGAGLLVVTLAIQHGVDQWLLNMSDVGDQMRRVRVMPGDKQRLVPVAAVQPRGAMTEEKRERMRKVLERRWLRDHPQPQVLLDRQRLDALARIPHVERVVPYDVQPLHVELDGQREEVRGTTTGLATQHVRERLVAGKYFAADDQQQVLIHESLAYRWGYRDDGDVEKVVGEKIRVEYRPLGQALADVLRRTGGPKSVTAEDLKRLDGLFQKLPTVAEAIGLEEKDQLALEKLLGMFAKAPVKTASASASKEFTVAGVFRDVERKPDQIRLRSLGAVDADVELIFPARTAARLSSQMPAVQQNGYRAALVVVDEQQHVSDTVSSIRDMGLEEFSMVELLERIRTNLALVTYAMSLLGVLALVVATIGITNTMVMSVLERTYQIGIMKAIGSSDGTVSQMFLIQGGLIGLVAGACGVLLGWGLSFPAEFVFKSQLQTRNDAITESLSLFEFPWWLVVGTPLFCALMTMLGTYFPARRAARINPSDALRHG